MQERAISAAADTLHALFNANLLTDSEGHITESEATRIESSVSQAIRSNCSMDLVCTGLTVQEALDRDWDIPKAPADYWVWCRSIRPIINREKRFAIDRTVYIRWQPDEPQCLPFGAL